MKWILKILTTPVILLIDMFTLVCMEIISFSAIPLRIVSSIIAFLGTAVLVTYSPKNGMILLAIAFLFSPMGLPMLAVWILSILQSISQFIKAIWFWLRCHPGTGAFVARRTTHGYHSADAAAYRKRANSRNSNRSDYRLCRKPGKN